MNISTIVKGLGVSLVAFILVFSAWVVWISFVPDEKPISEIVAESGIENHEMVVGDAMVSSLVFTIDTLLGKSGGYTSNDIMVKYVDYFDDMPNWEFGVLVQARDLAKSLRNDFSRSQSTSKGTISLEKAEPKLNIDSVAFMFPSAEKEYRLGKERINDYLQGIADPSKRDVQFYARADNLKQYLTIVEMRLGSLSQNLSASVDKERPNTDLANDPNATQSTYSESVVKQKTPYFEIDDNYWQARGSVWALLHYFKAIKVDFERVLSDKNAVVSVEQIIAELEAANESLSTPMVLNGSGRGIFANHSLTMSSYISRANAAVIQLRSLLEQG